MPIDFNFDFHAAKFCLYGSTMGPVFLSAASPPQGMQLYFTNVKGPHDLVHQTLEHEKRQRNDLKLLMDTE